MQNQIKEISINHSFSEKEIIIKKTLSDKINIFFGINGCGKSTAIKIITGCINSKKSKISYIVKDEYQSYYDFVLNNVYLILDEINFIHEYITVKDFFKYNNIPEEDIINLRLEEFYNKMLIELSHGTRKKIELLKAFNSNKDILIFDEITNGIDEYSKDYIAKMFNNCNAQIILSTHDTSFLDRLDTYEEHKF